MNFYTHDVPTEMWEDRDQDGAYDLHAFVRADAQIVRVRADQDFDGVFEVDLEGEGAMEMYDNIRGRAASGPSIRSSPRPNPFALRPQSLTAPRPGEGLEARPVLRLR